MGCLFLVTEFVRGANLRQTLEQQTSLGVSRSCRIVWEIASALEAGQQLGMLHGEIKPEHILLSGPPLSEQTKLLDFSLDRVKDALPELSGSDLPPGCLSRSITCRRKKSPASLTAGVRYLFPGNRVLRNADRAPAL